MVRFIVTFNVIQISLYTVDHDEDTIGLKQKKKATAGQAVAAAAEQERARGEAKKQTPQGKAKARRAKAEDDLHGTWLLPFKKPDTEPTLFGSEELADVQSRCCCTWMLVGIGWPLTGVLISDVISPSWSWFATVRILVLSGYIFFATMMIANDASQCWGYYGRR